MKKYPFPCDIILFEGLSATRISPSGGSSRLPKKVRLRQLRMDVSDAVCALAPEALIFGSVCARISTASKMGRGVNGTMNRWPWVTPPSGTIAVKDVPSYIAKMVCPASRSAGATI